MERGYNVALAKSKARMQLELRLGEWLAVNQKLINRLHKTAAELEEQKLCDYYGLDSTPAGYPGGEQNVTLVISARDLQGLKDPRLEQIITPFLDAPESKCQDYAQYLNRDYHFIYPVEGGKITIMIGAYVAEENPTCRKILVERKTVARVEEVYKLSCDGDIVEADPVNPKLGNEPLTLENEA